MNNAILSYPAEGFSLDTENFRDHVSTEATPSSREPHVEIVFPPDTRTKVTETTEFPYVAMGQLIMDFPNGKRYTGTATLIDNRHVLTAAHNIYGKDIGGWAKNVWYVPARNGDERPYGIVGAERLFITEEYFTLSPPDPNSTQSGTVADFTLYTEDYAVVRLQKAVDLPLLGMFSASDEQLRGPITITGYPGDKPNNTMWTDTRDLTNPDDHFLFYRVNTYKGESGAAVTARLEQPVGLSIVGVHVAGDQVLGTNFGVRLIDSVIRQILSWVNQ